MLQKLALINDQWQCLTTIGLCTYVILHVNVPPKPLSLSKAVAHKLVWVLVGESYSSCSNVSSQLTAIQLVSPEFVSLRALVEFSHARKLKKQCASNGHVISLSQAFYLTCGGLRIRGLYALEPDDGERRGPTFTREPEAYDDDAVFYYEPNRCARNGLADDSTPKLLADKVPSTRDILDKSKADALAKFVTCAQTAWTLTQIIARQVQNLTISLIEYETAAYIAMAAISYNLWWQKPYDVLVAQTIEAQEATDSGKLQLDVRAWKYAGKSGDTTRKIKRALGEELETDPYINVSVPVIFVLLNAVFAGIHLSAWCYGFSSEIEGWAWRISCIVACVAPVVVTFSLWKAVHMQKDAEDSYVVIVVLPLLVYAAVRVYMIVECFIAFRDAPAGIYKEVEWSNYIPHVM